MAALSNDDVAWTTTFDGYAPLLSDRARQQAADITDEALLAMLDDPGAFVLAHVLLTERSGRPYSTFPEWNGLVLLVDASGAVTIDPAQRVTLAQKWRPR